MEGEDLREKLEAALRERVGYPPDVPAGRCGQLHCASDMLTIPSVDRESRSPSSLY
jgi:hypothetical protein